MPKGGKRLGAGRRLGSKNKQKKSDVDEISRKVLRSIDCVAIWKKILHGNSPKTIASSLMYLMDRLYGRPAQVISGSGTPIQVQFSWPAAVPEWMNGKPELLPVNVESRVIEERLLQQVVNEQVLAPTEDESKD